MKATPKQHFTFLATGRRFHIGVDRQPVNLHDIAAQLAKINRFAGATEHFYSVAQHAVLVSNIALSMPGASALIGLQALHHDDHEMISSDIPVPFRRAIADAVGRDIVADMQDQIDATIAHGLGISWPPTDRAREIIAAADRIAFATEIRDVLPDDAHEWDWGPLPAPWRRAIKPLPWAKAEEAFLARHDELARMIGARIDDAA